MARPGTPRLGVDSAKLRAPEHSQNRCRDGRPVFEREPDPLAGAVDRPAEPHPALDEADLELVAVGPAGVRPLGGEARRPRRDQADEPDGAVVAASEVRDEERAGVRLPAVGAPERGAPRRPREPGPVLVRLPGGARASRSGPSGGSGGVRPRTLETRAPSLAARPAHFAEPARLASAREVDGADLQPSDRSAIHVSTSSRSIGSEIVPFRSTRSWNARTSKASPRRSDPSSRSRRISSLPVM